MAHFFPYLVDSTLLDQIKNLPTEELLDFWEETQFLDDQLEQGEGTSLMLNLEYERAVLLELQIRKWTGRLDIEI
jgi:hypothetical protein